MISTKLVYVLFRKWILYLKPSFMLFHHLKSHLPPQFYSVRIILNPLGFSLSWISSKKPSLITDGKSLWFPYHHTLFWCKTLKKFDFLFKQIWIQWLLLMLSIQSDNQREKICHYKGKSVACGMEFTYLLSAIFSLFFSLILFSLHVPQSMSRADMHYLSSWPSLLFLGFFPWWLCLLPFSNI